MSPRKTRVDDERKKSPPPINSEAIKAIFVDGFGIGISETKDILEIVFLSVHDNQAYVNSRYVMTKERAKDLIEAIEDALEKIE